MMHRNQYLIDMCTVEGCTVLDDSCTECGTPNDWNDTDPNIELLQMIVEAVRVPSDMWRRKTSPVATNGELERGT